MKKIISLFVIWFAVMGTTGCSDKVGRTESLISEKKTENKDKYYLVYSKCMSSAAGINNAIVAGCSEEAVELADKDMEAVLEKIYTRLKDDEYKALALKNFQSAWVTYLNAEVEFDSAVVGSPQGEITRFMKISERINYLNSFLSDIK
jgi:uncharacterized protein YecT (DUF1311 family)